MGCGFSDEDWQTEIENAEQQIFIAAKDIDMDKLVSKYTVIELRGESLAIRTHIYNDDKTKKTLLMTHGYAMAAPYFIGIIPKLAEHYRIVFFDNCAWGTNSRTDEVGDALETPEKAEAYIIEWWEKLIAALGDDLPPKFYLTGHSAGGF